MIIRGPALLSMARHRNVCTLCLIKAQDVFHFTNIVPIIRLKISLQLAIEMVHKF